MKWQLEKCSRNFKQAHIIKTPALIANIYKAYRALLDARAFIACDKAVISLLYSAVL